MNIDIQNIRFLRLTNQQCQCYVYNRSIVLSFRHASSYTTFLSDPSKLPSSHSFCTGKLAGLALLVSGCCCSWLLRRCSWAVYYSDLGPSCLLHFHEYPRLAFSPFKFKFSPFPHESPKCFSFQQDRPKFLLFHKTDLNCYLCHKQLVSKLGVQRI